MNEADRKKIELTIERIKDLHTRIAPLVSSFEERIAAFKNSEGAEYATAEFWHAQALRDSLIRTRIFIENNFSYIETLGVLSLCRYTFEMVVWLKHMKQDENYALVYARMLFKKNLELYEDLASHLVHEIGLYKRFADEETKAHAIVLENIKTTKDSTSPASIGSEIAASLREASDAIDEKLALNFVLYGDDIAQYGYGFQAHRVETQALPQARQHADQTRETLKNFDTKWDKTLKPFKPKVWSWKERADFVGMLPEYDFIYSYTSRLIHATPVSITTDQRSLESFEMLIFLRYVATQFYWIIRHAETEIARRVLH